MSTTIMDDLKILGEQLERLQIENRLLRAASEEQRELNGKLREEYNSLKEDYTLVIKESSISLKNWSRWFDVWSIMLDGTCYDDAYDYYRAHSITLKYEFDARKKHYLYSMMPSKGYKINSSISYENNQISKT